MVSILLIVFLGLFAKTTFIIFLLVMISIISCLVSTPPRDCHVTIHHVTLSVRLVLVTGWDLFLFQLLQTIHSLTAWSALPTLSLILFL